MITEDIDVSWRLQFNSLDLHYVTEWCWKLSMPETSAGL